MIRRAIEMAGVEDGLKLIMWHLQTLEKALDHEAFMDAIMDVMLLARQVLIEKGFHDHAMDITIKLVDATFPETPVPRQPISDDDLKTVGDILLKD